MTSLAAKIIIVGGMGSGKSCLLLRFADEVWAGSSSQPTIGVDFKTRTVDVRGGNAIRMQVWDCSGQEEFLSVARSYFRESCAALVVYDVTSRASFAQVPKWMDAVRENAGNKELVICLVGAKADLEQARKVSRREGEAFARDRNLLFVECSAKTGDGVEFAFASTASAIFRKVDQGLLDLDDVSHGVKRDVDGGGGSSTSVRLGGGSSKSPARGDQEWCCM